jgi:hypothetical protein
VTASANMGPSDAPREDALSDFGVSEDELERIDA